MTDSTDWEIDSNGFYVAIHSFLVRRGFCCANQCRNCPYINWRDSPARQTPLCRGSQDSSRLPESAGGRAESPGTARAAQPAGESEAAYHQAMIAYYRLLLERWEPVDD